MSDEITKLNLGGNEPNKGSDDNLQFDRAEYARPAGLTCAGCKQRIEQSYYVINGQVHCTPCYTRIEMELMGESGIWRFTRAALFGVLAAALGSGIYYAVRELTGGWEFSLVSIVVGLLVGGAVKRGSNGRGGWRYQALAMFLTYTAIVSTYIPTILKAVRDQSTASASPASATATPQPDAGRPDPAGNNSAGSARTPETPKAAPVSLGRLLFALAALLAFACMVPFLAGFQNILGWIIIGIGLYEAWKINKRDPAKMAGPFAIASDDRGPSPIQPA